MGFLYDICLGWLVATNTIRRTRGEMCGKSPPISGPSRLAYRQPCQLSCYGGKEGLEPKRKDTYPLVFNIRRSCSLQDPYARRL